MANKQTEYKFKIDVFSPTTIPMLRLGEYMSELAKLLANASNVHFARLEEGSCTVVSMVDWEALPKVRNRVQSVKRSEAANDANEANTRLNAMLREDNATGKLFEEKEDGALAEVLHFPGREIPKPQRVGPFNQPATIKAQLYRIGGRDETAHAQLLDTAGRTWSGDLTQGQATEMAAAGLYRWFMVSGLARWIRAENNLWEVISFHIHDFKPLTEGSLEEDLKHIRSIEGSEWPTIADPLGHIQESRKDDDEIH